jgi:hypothetical protein
VIQTLQKYPYAMENPAAAKHLGYTVQRSDRLADFEQRTQIRHGARMTDDLMKTTGMTPEEFQSIQPDQVRFGKFVDDQGKEVPLNHPGGSFTNQYTGAEKGGITQIDTSEGPLHMTRAAYARYRRAFGMSQPQPATQPTPALTEAPVTQGAATQDQFQVGRQYRDAQGNVATYQGEGKWQ